MTPMTPFLITDPFLEDYIIQMISMGGKIVSVSEDQRQIVVEYPFRTGPTITARLVPMNPKEGG